MVFRRDSDNNVENCHLTTILKNNKQIADRGQLLMKSYIVVAIMLIILSVISTKSYAFNLSQNICEYIAADDKNRLRKLLKTNRLKIRNIFDDIKCNDSNILIFAAKRNAKEVGELIIKKLPKSVLSENVAQLEGESADFAQMAKDRIN